MRMCRCTLAMFLVLLTLGCGMARASAQESPQRITLLVMADLHAQLNTHPELFWDGKTSWIEPAGGLARVAGYVEALRKDNPTQTLFIDLGDTFQGSGPASLSEGFSVVEPMNALKPDMALPGNWEVAYGAEGMLKLAKALDYPIIAANVYDQKTKALVFPPYIMMDLGGVRVAVIGYTDPDVPERQPPSYSMGLDYAGPEVIAPCVQAVRKKGADVVILATHVGLIKAVQLARDIEGLDIVLSGDTHERTLQPIEVGKAWVVEPGAFGSFLGRLDLTIQNAALVERHFRLITLTEGSFPEDAQVKEAVSLALAPFAERMGKVLGKTTVPLYRYGVLETALDAVITDAMREAAHTEIALSNGFRFGPVIEAGPVKAEDMWAALPNPEPLKVGKVYGRQLKAFLEEEIEQVFSRDPKQLFGGWLPRFSGMSVTFEAFAKRGEHIKEILVNGKPLEEGRLYSVVSCQREGDGPDVLCRIPEALETQVLGVDIHQALEAYLKHHDPLEPPRDNRMIAVDLPPVVRSQYEAIVGAGALGSHRPLAGLDVFKEGQQNAAGG